MISFFSNIPWGLIAYLVACVLGIAVGVYFRRWQLVAGGVLAAIVGIGWERVTTWQESHHKLPKVEAALKLEQDCGEGSQCAERVKQAKLEGEQANQEAVEKYEQELEELRNRPIPHRVIRVCPSPDHVRDATGSAGTGSGPAAEGVVHGEDELDTRPLRELAQQADEVSARCRALLERDRRLAKTNRSD